MNISRLFGKKQDEENSQNNQSNSDSSNTIVPNESVPANWIVIAEDGEFICSECNNKSAPETNTENGTVTADLTKIKDDLTQFPTKVVYGICPICGMEFTFKMVSGQLYLEPSEMMK